jgi:hypothetical protein
MGTIPKVMLLTPKKTHCLDTREEAECLRLDLLEAGAVESDVVIVEQLSFWEENAVDTEV